jgi:hypothetical protein
MENSRKRTLMGLLLGAWLVGTIIVGFVAAENFWIVDKLLATSVHPVFHTDVGLLPAGEARNLMRYLVSEQNRLFFVWWGWAEVILGIALLAAAFTAQNSRSTLGITLMLAITLAMQFYFTPQIVDVGRTLDFVPRDPAPPQMSTFGWLHAAYSTLDLIKLVIGFWVVWRLLKRPRTEPDTPVEKTMEPNVEKRAA